MYKLLGNDSVVGIEPKQTHPLFPRGEDFGRVDRSEHALCLIKSIDADRDVTLFVDRTALIGEIHIVRWAQKDLAVPVVVRGQYPMPKKVPSKDTSIHISSRVM